MKKVVLKIPVTQIIAEKIEEEFQVAWQEGKDFKKLYSISSVITRPNSNHLQMGSQSRDTIHSSWKTIAF